MKDTLLCCMSALRIYLRYFFAVFCFCAVSLWQTTAWTQKNISTYLTLQGQARLDSLTLWQHIAWYDYDSSAAFAEIDVIKRHALKTNDAILAVFSDQLRGFYFLIGKQKDYKAAYKQFKNALKQLKKLPPSTLTTFLAAENEHFMGVTLYLTRDDFDKCINHLLAADLAYRKIGYENHLFASYRLTYLALYYLKIVGDYETALRYLKEGEAYVRKNPVDFHRIQLYRNIALCLVEKKQYAEAVRYNQLGIAQVRTRKDSLRVGALNGNIGEIILNHYPNPVESEPYFRKELMYRSRFDPDKKYDDIAKVYGNLCQIEGYKRNRANVVAYFNKALALLGKHENKTEFYSAQYAVYKNRMIADTLLGDYKSALHYELLGQEALAKMNKQDLRLAASEASVRFDAEKLKLQAELANEQSQNSRFWIAVVSLLLLVALIGGYFLYYRQRTRKDELARQLSFEQKEAERLAELDRLKTRFFTNISHEFRTPLTLILSPLKALQKEFPKRDIFQLMNQNAERLLTLINQLLDLSKLEAGKMDVQIQQGDLPPFLKYVFASFESLAQNRAVLFHYHQTREHQTAYFDADKLEKIISNLLSNAFKFTPENGRVEVRVDYTDRELVLTVQDFGIGIEAEHLPRIFDRFYQKDDTHIRDYEGTGIGLALVKELVEVLKGTIAVESQPGKGTTFRVHLPIDKQTWEQSLVDVPVSGNGYSPAVSAARTQSADAVWAEGELPVLLIVEDNTDLRRYIRSQFENDYQVLEAKDGQEGLEKAIEVVPDLVICDLMMPRLDGFGFCRALKTDMRTSHIPTVMLTAKATLEDRLEGLETGADDYLAKPFNTDELQIRVRNLIAVRETLRQKYNRQSPASEPKVTPKVMTADDEFLQKIGQIIEQNLTNPHFEVESLAGSLKMTSPQLRRKLKALTNQTIVEFIRNYRLEKAVALLKNKKGNVSEVAYEVGFESLPYFSKVFQEKFGISASLFYSEGELPNLSKNTPEK